MCGICGVVAFRGELATDEQTVVGMRDTIAHRGPDDAGVWCSPDGCAGLGHRRLSIVDLSPAGHQPMANEDGTVWLTFNGEIYNHLELRRELEAKGHRFRSNTDSETIVHLWEEDGPRCVERLHGMFAFGLWDTTRRQLLLARDRLGVKPLIYAPTRDGLVFGSEMRAVLAHPGVRADLDEETFFHFLTFAFSPPPRTMFRDVQKLGPAQTLLADERGTRITEYWSPLSPERTDEVRGMSDDELVDELHDRLRTSVRRRTMSDVPFGVFLSGGLDSSLNVALMAEVIDEPVRTFTTAPRDHAQYDELDHARVVARRFGTDHHEVVIGDDELADFIPAFLDRQDEPIGDWTSIPQHFVSKLARDSGTVVVQVGEGADELFHGYKGYLDHRRFVVPFQRFVPGGLQPRLGQAAQAVTQRLGRGIRHGEALSDAGTSRLPYWGGAICFRGELKERLLTTDGGFGHSYERIERLWDEAGERHPGVDLLQRMTYIELKQRLPEMLLMQLDRQTMANSIEGREPFLDHRVVEFALALPAEMKVRRGDKKHILKLLGDRMLPREIVHRPKQGFGTPMKEWLREGFGVAAERQVLESSLRDRGLLDYDRVAGMFAAHREGRGDWSKHLWNLYTLSAWHDRWIAVKEERPAVR